MMEHDEIKALLPLAAVDRLDADEARALEEHLSGCAECTAELREYREAAAALALSLDPASTEERIWSRLESRLHAAPSPTDAATRDREVKRAARPAGFWRPLAIVMAASAAAAAIYAAVLTTRFGVLDRQDAKLLAAMSRQITQLQDELASAESEVATFHRVLDYRSRLEKILMQPDLHLTRLEPLPASPRGAGAIVAVSAANHAAMIQVSGLAPTPEGKTYELWWITKESGPVAAGLFQVGANGSIAAPASPPPAGQRVLACAVTLEPAGGVSKPTGQMYLKGAPG
jgi:anti-sigma-K factor RskA